MTEIVGFILFMAVIAVVALELLGDPLMKGIGVRVLRRFKGAEWPPEKTSWQQWLVAVVVGWLVVLAVLITFWLIWEVVT